MRKERLGNFIRWCGLYENSDDQDAQRAVVLVNPYGESRHGQLRSPCPRPTRIWTSSTPCLKGWSCHFTMSSMRPERHVETMPLDGGSLTTSGWTRKRPSRSLECATTDSRVWWVRKTVIADITPSGGLGVRRRLG